MTNQTERKTLEDHICDITAENEQSLPAYRRWNLAMERLTKEYLEDISDDYIFNLLQKIEALQEKEGMILEYGTEGQPGGMFSGVRIRWMNTAGGFQYGIHSLDVLGKQTNGEYIQEKEGALAIALQREAYFNRPTRFCKKMKAEKNELTWFLFEEGQQRCLPNVSDCELGKIFRQKKAFRQVIETVSLDLPK